MNEIAVYTQTQMTDALRGRDVAVESLDKTRRDIVNALRIAESNGILDMDDLRTILENAAIPAHYYEHLFTVTVLVEVQATSTVSVVKTFEVEVKAGFDDDDLLEAFDEQHGLTASEIIADNTWDADWQDDELEVLGNEQI